MEYLKPILATAAPAIGGNVLGAIQPTLPAADQLPLIPALQGIAYAVSIVIGIFQICRYLRDRSPWGALRSWLQAVAQRYASPSSPLWRAVGDLALALIPALEAISFGNPEWEDRRLLVHLGLVLVKFATNLSVRSHASGSPV